MTIPIRRFLFGFLCLLTTGFPLQAFEVSTEFQIGNLGFAADRKSTATDYPSQFPWGVSIYGSEQITQDLGVDIGFYSDRTLKNISYTNLRYTQRFFTLGVGPFFGFFNSSTSLLKPGISTAVRLDFPGIIFIEFRADSSIGGRLVQEGDYLQERSDVTAGFYVLNAIANVNLLTKSYTYRTKEQEIIDSFVEYSFSTDIYQKNVPYRVLLTFAYQKRGKSYTPISGTQAPTVHDLNSLVLGTRIDLTITRYLSIMADLESSIYNWGSAGDALITFPTSGIGAYFFNATAGVTLNIDPLLGRRGL
ncbi:MAG: hypothetical protein JW852_08250 [Spirochaetales bacterium]|nr:hypothetical protein [Spirochaetales bacterium]